MFFSAVNWLKNTLQKGVIEMSKTSPQAISQRKILASLKRANRQGIQISVVGAGAIQLAPKNISKSSKVNSESEKAEALFA